MLAPMRPNPIMPSCISFSLECLQSVGGARRLLIGSKLGRQDHGHKQALRHKRVIAAAKAWASIGWQSEIFDKASENGKIADNFLYRFCKTKRYLNPMKEGQ